MGNMRQKMVKIGRAVLEISISQLYFGQTSSKTAGKELNTATLSD